MCRAMIQSLTFQYYDFQIISLIVSNILFVAITLIFRKQFTNKFIFMFFFIYNVLFFLLDFTLFLILKKPILMEEYNAQTIIYFIIWSLISSYLLLFLLSGLTAIY
jgi:hypothetical protein